jgi:hypothetical protein
VIGLEGLHELHEGNDVVGIWVITLSPPPVETVSTIAPSKLYSFAHLIFCTSKPAAAKTARWHNIALQASWQQMIKQLKQMYTLVRLPFLRSFHFIPFSFQNSFLPLQSQRVSNFPMEESGNCICLSRKRNKGYMLC